MSLAFDEYGRPFIIVKVRMVARAYVLSTARESFARLRRGGGWPWV